MSPGTGGTWQTPLSSPPDGSLRPGLIEVEWGKLLDRPMESRQEEDCLAMVEFEPEIVEAHLELAAQSLDRLRQVERGEKLGLR